MDNTIDGVDYRNLDELPSSYDMAEGEDLIASGVSNEPTPQSTQPSPSVDPGTPVVEIVDDASWGPLHVQLKANQRFWYPHKRTAAVWAFFSMNDPAERVNASIHQTMRCIVCHTGDAMQETSARPTKARKGIVRYNPAHGITSMKNHVDQNHSLTFERYKTEREEEEMAASGMTRKKAKKRPTIPPSEITSFFGSERPYNKSDLAQVKFMEDLLLFICKSYQPLSIVEDQWLRRFLMHQNPKVLFPSRRQLVREHLPAMLAKTMERYVWPLLDTCDTVSITFDLWMSRVGFDVFTLVENFISRDWKPCHVTIGLFEATDTTGNSMAQQMKPILEEFKLTKKFIAYVKDEGANLITMATALSTVVTCEPLGLTAPWAGVCFGHVMSKACQYTTDDTKVCVGMKEISLKQVQSALQKTITWTKRPGKGRTEWMAACVDSNLRPRKLQTPVKTRFANKVVLFQETLAYRNAITLCYVRQASTQLQSRVPTAIHWAVAKAVSDVLSPVVSQCVINQTRGYWLLFDAIVAAMFVSTTMQETDNAKRMEFLELIDGDFDAELGYLYRKMALQVNVVLDPFLAFLATYKRTQGHMMLCLMLDPRYKGLKALKKYLNNDRLGKEVVRDYDTRLLIPMLVKASMQLRAPAENMVASDDDSDSESLFGSSSTGTYEATESLCKAELGMFRSENVPDDVSPLDWWEINKNCFPVVGYVARQFLGIPGSQIECERIFSIAGVLTSLRRCRLGVDNIDKLVVICKNWPNDARTDTFCGSDSISDFFNAEADLFEDAENELESGGQMEEDEE